MSTFHQMGHHSNNLIDLPAMSAYRGAIFSPINSTQAEAAEQIAEVRGSKNDFEIIFDPQLYVPASSRGKLKKWPYFPKNFDTADPNSKKWWIEINEKLARLCDKLEIDSICSPSVIPRIFDDKYYGNAVEVANDLLDRVKGGDEGGTTVLQTVLVSLSELSRPDRALEIASIVSGTDADRIYLIFIGAIFPRRELSGGDELLGAMKLVSALERNHVPVMVGFCSSDILLWKTAGASDCASGKFFNLRRFTRQRFEEPTEGGGQLPYWFEEGLLAFLRQGDLIRARRGGTLSTASLRNPFGIEILALLDEAARTGTKPGSWLGLSWRQFLYWFADVEGRLSRQEATAEVVLTDADANWMKLDKAKILMEERENDGRWVRDWLNIVREFEGQ